MTIDIQVAAEAAVEAADVAETLIQQFLASGDWQVSEKPDNTPVTEVDVAVEKLIRERLSTALPVADFYGEETGRQSGDQSGTASGTGAQAGGPADSRWLVDPIDGTKSFIRDLPYFSTQIALEVGGELVVGVSNAPSYGQRLVAVRGQGVTINGKTVQVRRSITSLEHAFLSSGNLATLAGESSNWLRYGTLVSQVKRVRGYGDFCHYHQLCAGQADLIIESDVNILDIAALTVGVREAGGIITDLQGQAIDERTTSVLAAATTELHEAALDILH